MHVDLSSSLWLIDRERALGLISYFGTERVMFGTDYPVKRAEDELQRFEALGLSDADAERILGENFRSSVIGKLPFGNRSYLRRACIGCRKY